MDSATTGGRAIASKTGGSAGEDPDAVPVAGWRPIRAFAIDVSGETAGDVGSTGAFAESDD